MCRVMIGDGIKRSHAVCYKDKSNSSCMHAVKACWNVPAPQQAKQIIC